MTDVPTGKCTSSSALDLIAPGRVSLNSYPHPAALRAALNAALESTARQERCQSVSVSPSLSFPSSASSFSVMLRSSCPRSFAALGTHKLRARTHARAHLAEIDGGQLLLRQSVEVLVEQQRTRAGLVADCEGGHPPELPDCASHLRILQD